jgi:hypothetical protein
VTYLHVIYIINRYFVLDETSLSYSPDISTTNYKTIPLTKVSDILYSFIYYMLLLSYLLEL